MMVPVRIFAAVSALVATLTAACTNTNTKTNISTGNEKNDAGSADAGASGWPLEFGSTTDDEAGRAIATDSTDNVYVLGQYVNGPNGDQSLVAKFDPTGHKLWENTYSTICIGIAVDSSHSAVYLACSTGGSPGAIGSPEFIKLDLAGNMQTTKVLQTTMVQDTPMPTIGGAATAIGVDAAGDVFLAGLSDSPIMTATPVSPGEADFFVAKFDSSEKVIWVTMLGSGTSNQDTAEMAVAGDAQGNAYFGAETTSSLAGAAFAGGIGDAFGAKLDAATGHVVWAHDEGGSGEDAAWGIAVDASANVYLAGFSDSALDGNTNAGERDVVVWKYDSSGNKVWTREIGSPGSDVSAGVGLDPMGLPIVAGTSYDNFDGHTNSEETSGGGIANAIALKFDASGKKLWSNEFGTDDGEDPSGMTVDLHGNTFATGSATDPLGKSRNTDKEDVFVLRFSSNGQM